MSSPGDTRRGWPLLLAAAIALLTGGVRAVTSGATDTDVLAAVLLSVGLVVLGAWLSTELRRDP